MTARDVPRGVSWDFSKISVFPPDRVSRVRPSSPLSTVPLPGAIQAKLVVGEINDPLEHEADRVADQVVRMSDPELSIARAPAQLSRKCASREGDNALHRKETARHAGGGPALVEDVLRAPGESLDLTTRAYFEPRFGRDLGDVRVSADDMAARSAAAVGARAYTVGKRITFAAGQYAPGTSSGRSLLAHELAHVIQQSEGSPATHPAILRRAPDKYLGLTIPQLRKLVSKGDKGATEALYARYEAMRTDQLVKFARGRDLIAQDVYAKRVVSPRAAAGQGNFSKAGVQETLAKDIRANRTATGISRREPSAVTPDIEVEGGTVGAARTDIPGLEDRAFIGQSKLAGGPGHNPESSFPPATDAKKLSHTHGHAEQHIADQLEEAIAEIPREQLKGRKVWMLIEQEPCPSCAQGAVNLGTDAGVLKKLSLEYPELTFEIKNLQSHGLIVLKGTESEVAAVSGTGAAPEKALGGAPGEETISTPSAEAVPQPGTVTPAGGLLSRAGGLLSRAASRWGRAVASGLKGAYKAESIAAAIPEVVLGVADRVAAREAITRIEIKFAKEGFAKGVAAGVTGWRDKEVDLNLKNRVTPFRVQGLGDPAGFLTIGYILQHAEACENNAVDLGYHFSSSETSKWKKDMINKGLADLAKYGYYFRGDPEVYLFEYNFIDKLAWVLRPTTDPIIDEAIERGEKRKEVQREVEIARGRTLYGR
jgi:hypothetical protein